MLLCGRDFVFLSARECLCVSASTPALLTRVFPNLCSESGLLIVFFTPALALHPRAFLHAHTLRAFFDGPSIGVLY